MDIVIDVVIYVIVVVACLMGVMTIFIGFFSFLDVWGEKKYPHIFDILDDIWKKVWRKVLPNIK